ncbi:MAG TPA: 3-hydroxybutyryl-CoA dehydrogenase [Dehalococcoidia bacterium]|nr:3-hydroxybutyryl-CoA dehydrogenase [Dehalococcoidia bacterium]
MEIKKVGVAGCGMMGSGITQICARSGYSVVVLEANEELLKKGLSNIEGSLARAVERGKMSGEEKAATMGRIQGTVKVADFADCDLVIEAVPEDVELKRRVFADLDRVCPPHAILGSNTSSIPIMKMASATKRMDKVLGMHFFNPAHIMKLLEIIKTIATSDETMATVTEFGKSLGKTVVPVKDMPGFIVTRLLVVQLLEAVRALQDGLASARDIDEAQKLGLNIPMGPFEEIDLVGLDVLLNVADAMYQETKDPKWAAPPLLRQMVDAGYLGYKVKRGFYNY